ncbi:MAG TPA: site-specific DNA-methyltransferase, partial [Dehalococcoidia bacterium]|nr:site-specific DNA-methyltransferase [Dehalococcoidia bacterium]
DSWTLKGNGKDTDITSDEFMRFSDGFWYIPPESQRRGHPTPFPEELIYRLIKFYTYKGNIVFDMFGGTGTVAVVAQKISRHFIHIDISQKYCQIAQQRLETSRMLQEFPLSVGRTGRNSDVIKRRSSKAKTLVSEGKSKKIHKNRLLEKRGSYKPKESKHA